MFLTFLSTPPSCAVILLVHVACFNLSPETRGIFLFVHVAARNWSHATRGRYTCQFLVGPRGTSRSQL